MATGLTAMKIIPDNTHSAPATTERTVHTILNPSNSSMGRMELKNILQGNHQNYVSPFFLMDEFGPMHLSKGTPFRVDAHPHAGIIPTTYLFKGNAHHRDSMGNDFQYNEGDFIQFTSGKGALHMEETGDELYTNGGVFHGIQSWLNIPPTLKKSEPSASHLAKSEIRILEKEHATIRVILGEVFGVKSNLQLLMPVIYWHISLKANTSLELPVDPAMNAFVYVAEGVLEVNGSRTATKSQTILYERNGSTLTVKANEAAEFLVLGGQVNNEPYVANGPFVVNTEEELNQAYFDFQQGKFGDLNQTNGVKRR